MRWVWYGLVFVLGSFFGFTLIDAGHVLFNRFWFHNMYFMYLCVGAMVGLIMKVMINWVILQNSS